MKDDVAMGPVTRSGRLGMYIFQFRKVKGEGALETDRGSEDNIKMDSVYGGVDLLHLAPDR
jgi:hypothetical protein